MKNLGTETRIEFKGEIYKQLMQISIAKTVRKKKTKWTKSYQCVWYNDATNTTHWISGLSEVDGDERHYITWKGTSVLRVLSSSHPSIFSCGVAANNAIRLPRPWETFNARIPSDEDDHDVRSWKQSCMAWKCNLARSTIPQITGILSWNPIMVSKPCA